MDVNEYQKLNRRTAKVHRSLRSEEAALLDWTLGIAGEAGEVADIVKHTIFHNERIPKAEFVKELGDIMWYISQAAAEIEVPMSVVMQLNRDKLDARYATVYTDEESKNRKKSEFSIAGRFEELMAEYEAAHPTTEDIE